MALTVCTTIKVRFLTILSLSHFIMIDFLINFFDTPPSEGCLFVYSHKSESEISF